MKYQFNNTEAIYLQIMRELCYQILRGDYKAGDQLPTWVEAGLQFNVNHNTIARAYLEMSHAGIVETRRGSGTFVTSDQERLNKLHESMKKDLLNSFVGEMTSLGYSLLEIAEAFQDYLNEISVSSMNEEL